MEKVVEGFEPEDLGFEDLAEAAGDDGEDIFHLGRLAGFKLDGGDRFGQSAGDDELEVVEVGGDVEGESVGGDTARDVNADGGNLALGG